MVYLFDADKDGGSNHGPRNDSQFSLCSVRKGTIISVIKTHIIRLLDIFDFKNRIANYTNNRNIAYFVLW